MNIGKQKEVSSERKPNSGGICTNVRVEVSDQILHYVELGFN